MQALILLGRMHAQICSCVTTAYYAVTVPTGKISDEFPGKDNTGKGGGLYPRPSTFSPLSLPQAQPAHIN
jgi:hypothetical protein